MKYFNAYSIIKLEQKEGFMDVKNTIKLRNMVIGKDKLTLLAGPCAIENKDILFETAEKLKEITSRLGINYIFKSSFDKANRSSLNSYRGLGVEKGQGCKSGKVLR